VRTNAFIHKHKPLTETDLIELENRFAVQLPRAVRLHFLRHNGGRPRRTYYRTADGREYGVAWFYPIKYRADGSGTPLEEALELLRTKYQLASDMLPVAYDGGGADFCVNLTDASIWFINSHSGDGTAKFVAPSIDTFIGGMLTAKEFFAGKLSLEH
jgi:cell wall assembly regulator SMI1